MKCVHRITLEWEILKQMEDILSTWLSASSRQEFTIIIAGRIAGG
jgi:hypothetical protein